MRILCVLVGVILWLTPASADPIHDAASSGSVGEAQRILASEPAAWRKIDKSGMTPLLLAVREGQVDMVTFLLGAGADPNQTSPQNWSPLHEAAVTGNPEIVRLLIGKGAHPRVYEEQNHGTPLHVACFHGNLEICQLLVRAGADINARDRERLTPMWHARDQGHLKVVAWMKEHGAH